MELGGSDAFLVLDDADLDHTVAMAILGRFGNNGQTCIGAKRFIVVKSMMGKFLPRFIDAAKKLKLGSSKHPDPVFGALESHFLPAYCSPPAHTIELLAALDRTSLGNLGVGIRKSPRPEEEMLTPAAA
jgi:Aldehyde dehydrogenase family